MIIDLRHTNRGLVEENSILKEDNRALKRMDAKLKIKNGRLKRMSYDRITYDLCDEWLHLRLRLKCHMQN